MNKNIKIAYGQTVAVPIDQLRDLQRDLKGLSEINQEKLKNEILKTDFSFAPHAWKDHNNRWWLIDGHQRIKVLKKLAEEGFKVPKVPVIPIHAKNLKEAKRRVFQGVSQYGKIQPSALKDFIVDAKLDIEDIKLSFDFPGVSIPEFVAEHFRINEDSEKEEDKTPELPKKTVVKSGDLWLVGEHRLLCGDATDIIKIEKLINDQKVDMIFTDPPYGIKEKTNRDFQSHSRAAKGNNFKKIEGDDSTETAVKSCGILLSLNVPVIVIWGGNYFCHSLPEQGNWLVWDKREEDKEKDFNSDCELAWTCHPHRRSVRIFRHKWKGMIKASEHGQARVHPTQKPIALAEWSFKELNPEGKSVLDLFGGSGSTLIACEKTSRKCFMMEIDPEYCQVILERWCNFTQKDPVRADGVLFSSLKK